MKNHNDACQSVRRWLTEVERVSLSGTDDDTGSLVSKRFTSLSIEFQAKNGVRQVS